MKTLNTRELYRRKCELEDLKNSLDAAREELQEAVKSAELDAQNESLLAEIDDLRDALTSAESYFGDDERAELEEIKEIESEVSDFMRGKICLLYTSDAADE